MNRTRSFFTLIGLAALTTTVACQNDVVVCDPLGCISEKNFAQNIASSLQAPPGVVGYVVTVGAFPSVFGGNAVLSPSAAMLPNDLTNIASVTKMLTTFAVLKSLSNHGISLDAPIFPYLYSDWQSVAGLYINKITFRDLLTHRSGFPPDSASGGCNGGNTVYATLKSHIESNATPLPAGAQGVYSNCNFAMFRELLPQMEADSVVNVTPDDIQGTNPRASLSADFYINYVNQNVLGPSGVGLRSCTPTTNPQLQILSYPASPQSSPNTNWGDWRLSCGGGGWNLSGSDLTSVFNSLASGSLLTPGQQTDLYNGGSGANDPGLGWDNTVGFCPGANQNGRTYYWCKNGLLGTGPPLPIAGLETFSGVFKCNKVPVVVIVNSLLSQNITSVVTSAFNNPSTQASGSPQPCPGQSGQ